MFVVLEASLKSLPISDGHNATKDEAPFVVALKDKTSKWLFCGGAIIEKNVIATAHHCIQKMKKENIVATVGTIRRKLKGVNYDISDIVSFPGYPKTDLALLRTTKDIVFTKHIAKISLAIGKPPANEVARVYGWGVRTEYTL